MFWMTRKIRNMELFGGTQEGWYVPAVDPAHYSSPKNLTLSRAVVVLGK